MTVKNIEKNGNQATIVVEIDKELMESGVQKAYLKARKNIQLPGFRKGKAPRQLIEKMYGAHVFYEDGLEEIFPEVYKTAVVDQDLKAIGRPSLTDMDISEDGIVTLTLTTDTYPEVTLGQYKGLEVEKAEATVTDEQVQAELDRMAQNVASTEEVEKAAEMGDTANIDLVDTEHSENCFAHIALVDNLAEADSLVFKTCKLYGALNTCCIGKSFCHLILFTLDK